MHVVCYFSKAARGTGPVSAVRSLVQTCGTYAGRYGLTGLLAVADGYFLHLVEGDAAAVSGMVGRIQAFWNQEPPTILFERGTALRMYAQWSASIAQRPTALADMSQRMETMGAFFADDPLASPADLFRYFLTPTRNTHGIASATAWASVPMAAQTTAGHGAPQQIDAPIVVQRQPVRKVAVFSSSVLWFNPIFSHVTERFDAHPSALKISSTGLEADAFALDYADVLSPTVGPTRLVGISQDLLASTLSSPLLSKVELVVFLMRRSGAGSDTQFVCAGLQHPEVMRATPGVLFITPGGNDALSESLQNLADDAGMVSTEHVGSVLVGRSIWDAISDWLARHPPPPVRRA